MNSEQLAEKFNFRILGIFRPNDRTLWVGRMREFSFLAEGGQWHFW